jgi:hypothetical protein
VAGMSEDPSTQRLADRLDDLRLLRNRNRASHPVSVLRSDIVASTAPAEARRRGTEQVDPGMEPSIDQRAEALATLILSPVLARAEQLAAAIRTVHRSAAKPRP